MIGTGVVREGDIPQANLEVILKDEKGAEKGKTTSKDDGAFTFENVPPGAYKVSVTKAGSGTQRQGGADAKVEPGGKTDVPVGLFLK